MRNEAIWLCERRAFQFRIQWCKGVMCLWYIMDGRMRDPKGSKARSCWKWKDLILNKRGIHWWVLGIRMIWPDLNFKRITLSAIPRLQGERGKSRSRLFNKEVIVWVPGEMVDGWTRMAAGNGDKWLKARRTLRVEPLWFVYGLDVGHDKKRRI